MTNKLFSELVGGACFSTGSAQIIESRYDLFPERPLDLFMKIGENSAVWLRTGQLREFSPGQKVKEEKLLIIREQ